MSNERWLPAKFKGKDVYILEEAWDSGERLIPMKVKGFILKSKTKKKD